MRCLLFFSALFASAALAQTVCPVPVPSGYVFTGCWRGMTCRPNSRGGFLDVGSDLAAWALLNTRIQNALAGVKGSGCCTQGENVWCARGGGGQTSPNPQPVQQQPSPVQQPRVVASSNGVTACSNDKYQFVTRYLGASNAYTSSFYPDPITYSNCQAYQVDGASMRLCDAFSCSGADLKFRVREMDPNDEFSLQSCECGKPVPPPKPFVRPTGSGTADPNADFDPFGSLMGSKHTEAEVQRDEQARARLKPIIPQQCSKPGKSKWSGCDQPITTCVGGVYPGTKVMADLISKSFLGSWRGRTYDCTYVGKEQFGTAFPPYTGGKLSDHANGAAWDSIVKVGDFELGNRIANFACSNWAEIGITYVIFNHRRCSEGQWQPLRSGDPHVHAIHISMMQLSAMYLSEAEMTEILRKNGLEPKYPIYEYENEVQGGWTGVRGLVLVLTFTKKKKKVIGVNDDPQFILPVPPRPDLRVNTNNIATVRKTTLKPTRL